MQQILESSQYLIPYSQWITWTPEEAQKFEEEVSAAADAAEAAADQLELYGYKFGHRASSDRWYLSPENESLRQLVTNAGALKHSIRYRAGQGQPAMAHFWTSPVHICPRIVDARRQLLGRLLERMEVLRKDVD